MSIAGLLVNNSKTKETRNLKILNIKKQKYKIYFIGSLFILKPYEDIFSSYPWKNEESKIKILKDKPYFSK